MKISESNFTEENNYCVFAGFFVFSVVFAVFSGTMQNDFIALDDPDFIKNNFMIQSLNMHNLWEMATSLYQGVWHPLTWISHAIDYRIFGANPAGHHFTNVLLHSLNAVWVFVLFIRLAERNEPNGKKVGVNLLMGGLACAIFFGLHPLRVESVAWVSNRKDLLCAFFTLSTYWSYLSFVAANGDKRATWYSITVVLLTLALMSKSIAVTVPVVMLLMDIYPLQRWNSIADGWRMLAEKAIFLVPSLFLGVLTLVVLKGKGILVSTVTLSLHDRFLNACKGVFFYIRKTLWPTHLIPIYPLTGKEDASVVKQLLPLFGIIVITLVCFQLWKKKQRVLPIAWAYYLLTIAPVSGIVQAGRQAAADRYTYLSTLSFYFLIGLSVARIWVSNSLPQAEPALAKARNAAVLSLGAAIIIILGYMSIEQTKVWRNSEVFWGYISKSVPRGLAVADYNLGQIYEQNGNIKEAEAKYKKAIAGDARYVDAHNGLGLLYYEQGLYDEAEAEYLRALAIRPDAIVHSNLGLLYLKIRNLEKAKAEFLSALAMNPKHLEAHNNLGLLYSGMGLVKEAEDEFRAAITVDFDYAMAHLNLGVLYKKVGLLQQAEQETKIGIYLEPEKAEVHSLLGEIYLLKGSKLEADAEFKEARRLCLEKSKTDEARSNCAR